MKNFLAVLFLLFVSGACSTEESITDGEPTLPIPRPAVTSTTVPSTEEPAPNAATLRAEEALDPTSTPIQLPALTPTVTTTLELLRTSNNCDQLHEVVPQEDANKLLVTYVHDGDVWLWRGGDCTSIRLTEFRNVYTTRFVENNKTILFERLYPRPDSNSGGTGEVWAMDMDGNNQQLLLDRDELKDMYLERGWSGGNYEYSGLGLGQVIWLPDTKLIAFSTTVYFSELTSLPDDLRLLNLETGDYTTLLKAREAGEFKLSPDGEKFAIAMRDSINVLNWRTEEFFQEILTFEPVPCGCEGPHYVKPYWFPDSESLLVAIPSGDFSGDDAEAALWKIDVNSQTNEYLGSYSGTNRRDFFEELSSDLRYLVLYDYEQRTFNIFDLSREGQSSPNKELSGSFEEWHPFSDSFLFFRSGELLLGNISRDDRKLNSPLGDYRSQEAHWINDKYFIHYYHSGDRLPLNSNIAVGSISKGAIHIISTLNPNYSTLSFDFTMLP